LYIRVFLLSLLIPLTLQAAPQAADTAESVTACMRNNLPREFSVEDFILVSSTKNGSKDVIGGQIYFSRENRGGELGLARAMMRIKYPAPLRNSAYLMIETDDYLRDGMFVYLPAVDRIRRVSGTFADGRLFGTDISYFEFKQFRGAFGDMNPRLLGAEHYQGRAVKRMRYSPQDAADTHYEYAEALIDDLSCLPLKIDFIGEGQVRKQMRVPIEAIKADKSRWYMTEFSVRDLDRASETTFKTTGFDSKTDLSDMLFNPKTFHTAR
jgi:hypothetical protein